MKKIASYLLLFIMAFALITGCGKKTEDPKGKDEDPKVEDKLEDSTKKDQDGIVFSNIRIEKKGATSYVRGNVENKTKAVDSFKVQLIMSNKETERVYGRVDTEIKDLAVNEKRNFEVSIMGDYGSVNNFEVKIVRE